MPKKTRHIIAIGGGGFSTPNNNGLIELYFLKQTGKKTPKVCFIPTASGEADKYIIDFYKFFGKLGCKTSHLSLFEPPTKDLEDFILDKEAIYVGGGNTKSLMALWKEWRLDILLKKAWASGIVLGGVSAGANCWFEECVTDSIPGDLTALKCLGFLKGSCCPHYDSEKNRRPSYQRLLKEGHLTNGYAIDDFAALHFIHDQLAKVVVSKPKAHAYKVYKDKKHIIEEKLDTLFIRPLA